MPRLLSGCLIGPMLGLMLWCPGQRQAIALGPRNDVDVGVHHGLGGVGADAGDDVGLDAPLGHIACRDVHQLARHQRVGRRVVAVLVCDHQHVSGRHGIQRVDDGHLVEVERWWLVHRQANGLDDVEVVPVVWAEHTVGHRGGLLRVPSSMVRIWSAGILVPLVACSMANTLISRSRSASSIMFSVRSLTAGGRCSSPIPWSTRAWSWSSVMSRMFIAC